MRKETKKARAKLHSTQSSKATVISVASKVTRLAIAERSNKMKEAQVKKKRKGEPVPPGGCTICKKVGHKAEDFYFQDKNNKTASDSAAVTKDDQEINFVSQEVCMLTKKSVDDDFWIADSGASCHMKYNANG